MCSCAKCGRRLRLEIEKATMLCLPCQDAAMHQQSEQKFHNRRWNGHNLKAPIDGDAIPDGEVLDDPEEDE